MVATGQRIVGILQESSRSIGAGLLHLRNLAMLHVFGQQLSDLLVSSQGGVPHVGPMSNQVSPNGYGGGPQVGTKGRNLDLSLCAHGR